MHNRHWCRQVLACALALACTTVVAADLRHPDHYEFDATLTVPFQAQAGRFPIRLDFDYPGAGAATQAAWVLEVLDAQGQVVGRDSGLTALGNGRALTEGRWNGRAENGKAVPNGYYTVRLRAVPTVAMPGDARLAESLRVQQAFEQFGDEMVEQRFDVMLGRVPAARLQPIAPLRTARQSRQAGGTPSLKADAGNGLPYTIYYGNMHSQTNHSDGGTPVASCGGSEVPQGGVYGPSDAYTMMRVQAGGDFLLASEHNHMYDGSTSTRTSAVPADAIALFDSGMQQAASTRSANPDFMAMYGLEWGVISNGGHLNIINPDALAEWEYNASGQLIGEVFTAKSDYPALYATMKQRGWIGQFNHPASSGQFLVNGIALGYDPNGAEVMVLAEVLNSSAFSTNTTQTETSRSSYVGAWNKLLESGYRVAPATDQDNHCANWGLSFTNRTGVLLPSGTALSEQAFHDALRARRTFATEDRSAQLVLTANGRVMGDSFANSGPLTLTANYASTSGQTAQRVQFFEGVPGRNGTVTQLTEGSGSYSFTPATGKHFYYALVTQADGLRLWSAPVWVDQGGTAPADTTPPTVNAAVGGSSGTITLSANASDNVGVSRVEFLVDGVLVGTDSTPAYAMTLDSTTLANGSHTLAAKAFDAAGNSTTSAAVAFSISNTAADTVAPTVAATESGGSGIITLSATASDNVGVTQVEFQVDGVTRGSDATSPYSIALDSTTLANGSHTLVARASDAAGNVGISSAVAFAVDNSGGSTGGVLTKGVTVTGISQPTAGASVNYTMVVPAGSTNVTFTMSGGTGDADMYVKLGSAPTDTVYDCRPYKSGNAETCTFATTTGGTYYVRLKAYSAFSGVSLVGNYTAGGGGGSSQTYTNTTDVSIPDNNATGVTSNIAVSGRSGNGASSTPVAVNIVHPYIGDLIVDLVAPDGSVYSISNRAGGSADNINMTVNINLSGEALNGTWKLRAKDRAAADVGYINSWSITF